MSDNNGDDPGEGESELLAEFGGRRDRDSGTAEKVRIVVGPWQGRYATNIRLWYWHAHPKPDDDGWRPTKKGVVIRESELDETIAALEEVRRRVQAEGRATSRAPEGQRNPRVPRARTVAKQATREQAQQQEPARTPTAPPRRPAYQLEAEDDLAEFRKR